MTYCYVSHFWHMYNIIVLVCLGNEYSNIRSLSLILFAFNKHVQYLWKRFLQTEDRPRQAAEYQSRVSRINVKLQR